MCHIALRGIVRFPVNLAAGFAVLLIFLPCLASAWPRIPRVSPPFSTTKPYGPALRLSSRQEVILEYPDEHVVLADCTQGPERYLSSQLAYYQEGEPGPKPMDIAVVKTEAGQTALWVNSVHNATFTDTAVWFQATIGHKVDDGEYAGIGVNGYDRIWHNFTCWQRFKYQLYKYGSAECSMVYDCNHKPAPVNAPAIIISSTTESSTTATSTSGTVPVNSSGAPTDQSQPTSDTGLSTGARIGAIVGAVGILVIGGLAGIWFLLRRRSRNKKTTAAELDQSQDRHEVDDGTHHGYGDKEKLHQLGGRYELDTGLHVAEMDTEPDRYEMGGHEVAELDATEIRADGKDRSDIKEKEIIERSDRDEADTILDEQKARMPVEELKIRAIDKAQITAAKTHDPGGGGKEKHIEIPPKPRPIRTQTQTTWRTESDMDLAGFPLVLISPISPFEPKPPDG